MAGVTPHEPASACFTSIKSFMHATLRGYPNNALFSIGRNRSTERLSDLPKVTVNPDLGVLASSPGFHHYTVSFILQSFQKSTASLQCIYVELWYAQPEVATGSSHSACVYTEVDGQVVKDYFKKLVWG